METIIELKGSESIVIDSYLFAIIKSRRDGDYHGIKMLCANFNCD